MVVNISTSDNLNQIKNKNNVCLIGGLGDINLFVDFLDLFELKFKIIPKKYHIITSPEINEKFKDYKLDKDKVNSILHLLDYQTELRENYFAVYNKCKTIIDEEKNNYEIICELTGGTKPVSIALMALAEKYNLLRFYYSGKKIISI